MKSKCEICGVEEDVQFLLVRNSKSPQVNHKEFLCQEHLRKRSAQLEFMRLAGILKKELEKTK